MRFQLESRRREPREVSRTTRDLEHARALTTPEMMVMGRSGAFIAGRIARQLDRNEPAVLNHRVDRAIDGCHSQSSHACAPSFEYLERTQRTRSRLEDLANGVTLTRLAFHGSNMNGATVACRPCWRFDFASMEFAAAAPMRALTTRRQWLVFLALAFGATVVSHLLDETAWRLLRDPRVYEKDLGRLLRILGYLPTWLIVAIALWTHDRATPERRSIGWGWRGGLILLAPTLGGALAEVLKMLLRRLRPSTEVFGYVWRPFSEDFISTRGLGLPSSHALVAFAAATVLARLFPRAWGLWYLVAAGCALTRLLATAHYLSDTVVAALVGYVVGVLLARAGGFGRALVGPSSAE